MMNDLTFVFESGSVPVGSYLAKFVGVEVVPPGEYQEGIRWIWEIASGQYVGRKVSRISGKKPSLDNKAGKFISGMTGKQFQLGESISLAPCVGKTFLIVMGQSKSGASVVESVSLPPV